MLNFASKFVNYSCGACRLLPCKFSSQKIHRFYGTVHTYPRPYVDQKYSYAYGRSTFHLEPRTLGQVLRERATKDGNKVAVISEHESLTKTFDQLNTDVDHLVNAFSTKLGLRPGDIAALWTSNCYNAVLLQLACARYGLVLSPLNPVYKKAELEYALGKSEAKVIFLPGIGSKQEAVNSFGDVLGQVDLNHLRLKYVITLDSAKLVGVPGMQSHYLHDLIEHGKTDQAKLPLICGDRPFIIMFTSGTTGKPKGAVLTQHQLVNMAGILGWRLQISPEQRSCLPLPMFHLFGMHFGTVIMSHTGMSFVLTGYRYNVQSVVDAVNKYNCTYLPLVPTMTADIANYLERENVTMPSVKAVLTGGANTPIEVARKFVKVVPSVRHFLMGYGTTETTAVVTWPTAGEGACDTMTHTGTPIDFVQVKIMDTKTNQITKHNEQGEIWVRGYNIMRGYWKDEQKTREALTQAGWYKTGDVGIMDEHGHLKIVGRTKELIIRGGENVYPAEVEQVLFQHPSVQTAAVCSVPDKRMGEEICAWIVLKANTSLTADEIRTYCKERISYFKVPRYVLFVNSVPTTATGKVQKFKMTEESCKTLGLLDENV